MKILIAILQEFILFLKVFMLILKLNTSNEFFNLQFINFFPLKLHLIIIHFHFLSFLPFHIVPELVFQFAPIYLLKVLNFFAPNLIFLILF